MTAFHPCFHQLAQRTFLLPHFPLSKLLSTPRGSSASHPASRSTNPRLFWRMVLPLCKQSFPASYEWFPALSLAAASAHRASPTIRDNAREGLRPSCATIAPTILRTFRLADT